MASDYEREESILRARGLLDGGYEPQAVYERLLSDGLSEDEAAEIMQSLTGKAHESAELPVSLSSLVEAAPVAQAPASLVESSQPAANADFRRQKEAANMAITLLDGGYDTNYVRQKLQKEGFSDAEIQTTLSRLASARRQNAYAQSYNKVKNNNAYQGGDGGAQVMIGIAMIVIGIGITFFSYQAAASNPNGGTYVVTFGLVIAGIFRVIKGLSQ